ncbi:hypothetical protein VPH35_020168 [Triticum aestivum]
MDALPHLPDDVLVEILIRLPARYIAGCRAVCRAWRSVMPHPNFDRAHARRPTVVAKVAARHELYCYGLEGNWLLHCLRTRVIVFDFISISRQRTPFPRALWFTSALSMMVVGSWDDVVCLERGEWPPHPRDRIHLHVHQYVLWNPLTMACATVGPSPAREGCIIGGYAHPETRRFHLLHTSGTGRCFLLRVVGDAVWREISFLEESSAHADAAPPRILMSRHPHSCFIRLHDNLHWPVQSMRPETSSTPRLLTFDTMREKFWWMETPERHGRPFYEMMTRISVLPCGKLGVFSLWVLDDHSGGPRARGSWRLKERISLINWDGSDLSWTFLTDSPVEDAEEGEELLLKQLDGRIDAYNIRRKAWRPMDRATFVAGEYMVMHRESVLQDQSSFGNAARPLRKYVDWYVDWYGQRFYCL